MLRQGKCHACNTVGPPGRERDFLCDGCADPEAATVVCAKCLYRVRFEDEEEMRLLAKYLPPGCDVTRGSVFRLECCAQCTDILPKHRSIKHLVITD